MTEQKIYFQWQNEALVKTIYPLRLMNLRNTLEFFMEIDLWARYKDKKIEDLSGEVATFHATKAAVIKKALQDYRDLLDFFYDQNLRLDPARPADEEWLKKVRGIHGAFRDYFKDKVEKQDSFRQSYFITQRLETLDRSRKELDKQVSFQVRRIDAMKAQNPGHPNLNVEHEKLTALRNTQPIFEAQREKLVALVSAFGKLEKRKKEYAKKVAEALAKEKEIKLKLDPLNARINVQEAKLREMQDELQRLRTPPDVDSVTKYFSVADVTAQILSRFNLVDQSFLAKVKEFHAALASLRGADVKLSTLKTYIGLLTLERARFERAKGKDFTFKELTLQAFDLELNLMKDYKSILEYGNKPEDVKTRAIKAWEEAKDKVVVPLRRMRQEAADLQRQIDEWDDILLVKEDKYLSQYQPVTPTVRDLARQKLEEYRETLKNLDQYQLLSLLIDRFKKEPARFPRWLQYMIVHFSGMRYSSAHGSWADPKDLYMNLRTAVIEKDLKQHDPAGIEELCHRKLAEYGASPTLLPLSDDPEGKPHPLAREDAEEWKQKVRRHLDLMQRDNDHARRMGLFNLLTDEENYELESMTEADALAALADLRARGDIPDWMWKELSAVTDLRLKEAKDANWDKLTPEEQQAKNSAEWAKYREMMNEWKAKHLVDWRKEHERDAQSLVSRAVCNEVAEHILHLRGHSGPAGLASAADWYIHAGELGKDMDESDRERPYFVKPKSIEDYRSGAAILWLKYRKDPPPQWNIVKPFVTTRGETILPAHYLNGGNWTYKEKGLYRFRTAPNEKGMMIRTEQYLFWVHIATVAEVGETADGKVALTYETSLPYEDRRLSCVGVFKRMDYNLTFDGGEDMYNGSFVGYMPDNPLNIPAADMNAMLDWDRILLRE
jgi:hypothetical protein